MIFKLGHSQLARQIIAAGVLGAILIPLWIPFDYVLDPLNFHVFLAFRIICVFAIITGLFVFIKQPDQQDLYYRKLGLLIYLALIFAIVPMCIMTEAKYPYYLGLSTVFFGVGILIIWPINYFILPMIFSMLVLGTAEFYTQTDSDIIVSIAFLMTNVGIISGLASWLRYHDYLLNESLLQQLKNLSDTDGLTGIYNRRYFDNRLTDEIALATRAKISTAVLLIDVDHFKQYNDYYGHQKGDECLQKVAQSIHQSASREIDMVARYGGEEFVVILPNSGVREAEIVAERIIKSIHKLNIEHEPSPTEAFVTVSIGIAAVKDRSAEKLVESADSALYKAKETGRNRFIVAGETA